MSLSTEVRLGILFFVVFGLVFYYANLHSRIGTIPPDFTSIPPIVSADASSMKEIVRGDATKKQVIFTFDGGDGAQSSEQILDALAKHHVTGTFFLTGKFIEAHPDIVLKISNAGHDIFSHTYDHPHLPEKSSADISLEMKKTEKALEDLIGKSPKPYFRAPYGDRDHRVLADEYSAGYQSVYWTVDALDWEQSSGRTAGEVEEIIMSHLASGNIYLMHLGDTITGEILDKVFTEIEAKGYRIVSLRQGI